MAQHEPGELLFRKAECRSDKYLWATITEKIAPAILADSWSSITIVNAPAARAADSAHTGNTEFLVHLNPGFVAAHLITNILLWVFYDLLVSRMYARIPLRFDVTLWKETPT